MLKESGSLIVEIGEGQGRGALGIATGAGFAEAAIMPDLSGAGRYLVAKKPRRT